MPVMPAAFFGHGNPMNALERNRYTEAWRAFGRSVPGSTPRSVPSSSGRRTSTTHPRAEGGRPRSGRGSRR